jgi:hypothetical protein
MNPQQSYVSVIEPISPAVDGVKTVLFRPFDLGRWFIIGFCAWLARLDDLSSGGGARIERRFHGRPPGLSDVRDGFDQAREFAMDHPWVLPAGITAFVLGIAFWLLLTWLSSRGRFMFLDCVAQNKAEVKRPWHLFRGYAHSLFMFRIVLGILRGLALLAFIVPVFVTVVVLKTTVGSTALSILGGIAYVLAFVIVLILFGVIGKFTKDFVVPIMYLHGVGCRQAWAVLLDLIGINKMRFVLYLLFQILIGVAVMTIAFGLGCITCGCACCFFALPYIGTVAFLPILIFLRAYSLYYLAQYGPDWNVFLPAPSTTPGAPQATS